MTKLTDLQLVLLSTAATRDDGNLLPPADSITAQPARVRRAIATLVERSMATDIAVGDEALSYRAEGDTTFGATITAVGRKAVGGEPEPASPPLASPPSPGPTKTATVLDLLRRSRGASLEELVQATGWLPHTTRAALTGLRKKGHAIARSGTTGASRYHLAA